MGRSRRQRKGPKPFEKWIDDWGGFEINECKDISQVEGAPPPPPWLAQLRKLCTASGCYLAYDPDRHWQESVYFPPGFADRRGIIWAGGHGNPKYCCTAAVSSGAACPLTSPSKCLKESRYSSLVCSVGSTLR